MMRGRVTARDLSTRLKEIDPDRELVIAVMSPTEPDGTWTWKLHVSSHETLWEYYGWVSGPSYAETRPAETIVGTATSGKLIELLASRDSETLLAMTGCRERKLVETRNAHGHPRPSDRPLWRI